MALITTDAIVLRSYNLAEADRIILCLTRNAGLVRAVAKGARRMKSRFGAALEPFTLIKLVFHEKENRELVTISSAEILKSRFDLAAQLEAADTLAYFAELVGEFAPPHEANEILFRMVAASIDALAESPQSGAMLSRYFEIWLLRLAGLFPEMRSCGDCGRTFSEEERVHLDSEDRPRCRDCSRGGGSALGSEARRTVNASQRLGPAEFAATFRDLPVEPEQQMAELTHRLIIRTLERRPRTMVASTRASHFTSHP
jgi:DNA repair protein RecO (recombination protein O)